MSSAAGFMMMMDDDDDTASEASGIERKLSPEEQEYWKKEDKGMKTGLVLMAAGILAIPAVALYEITTQGTVEGSKTFLTGAGLGLATIVVGVGKVVWHAIKMPPKFPDAPPQQTIEINYRKTTHVSKQYR